MASFIFYLIALLFLQVRPGTLILLYGIVTLGRVTVTHACASPRLTIGAVTVALRPLTPLGPVAFGLSVTCSKS